MDDDQSVANREPAAWLVTQKPDSKYGNQTAETYVYPKTIPNNLEVGRDERL